MNQEQFYKEFKYIVWLKKKITTKNNYIRYLSQYDVHGSHRSAILDAIQQRDKIKEEFESCLKGETYEWWLEFSKRLSFLKDQLKKLQRRERKIEDEIEKIVSGKLL